MKLQYSAIFFFLLQSATAAPQGHGRSNGYTRIPHHHSRPRGPTTNSTQTAAPEITFTATTTALESPAVTTDTILTPAETPYSSTRAFQIVPTTAGSTLIVPSSTSTPLAETVTNRYGSVVDTVDEAPPMYVAPGILPQREATGSIAVVGDYVDPQVGYLGGSNLLFRNSNYINITGTGYFQIRWEVAWFNTFGLINPPVWTGLKGKLFHVASGGGRRMDDAHNATDPTSTWMGPLDQRDTLPEGYQQMWQNEFYYLDGTVTLMNTENGVDYNLGYANKTWQGVYDDINTKPDNLSIKRYGKVRDTGDDTAPVPQFVTNLVTFNSSLAPMVSNVTLV